MAKKEETQKKCIRVANRQAWVDTFVYLCPQHRGGTGPGEYCESFDGTRTNCTGRCTYTGSGACEQVKQFFQTYIKFLNKDIE
ncbi:hypothetical protein, partial [Prevotella sp.]|uniref:hypothetical protein n=1 Tax=Prevotella sp. TaxID=59823 RepID=UPI003AF65BA5